MKSFAIRAVRKGLPPFICAVALIALWHIVSNKWIPRYLLPSPLDIADYVRHSWRSLGYHSLITFLTSFAGFIIGGASGICLAVTFLHSKAIEKMMYPYIIALKACPIVALAPLLAIWFGTGLQRKILVAALISFFPCVGGTLSGFRNIQLEKIDILKCYAASRWQILWKLRFPSAAPAIFAALKVSAPLAVVGAIVGEMAMPDRGLGYLLIIGKYRMEVASIVAAVFASATVALIFFAIVSLTEKKIIYWHKQD